ncbi:MAG: hypothetical protein IT424_10920 [Pirellulales bacterium]|nr:hypothetical protein [Pirellulales bacterium]
MPIRIGAGRSACAYRSLAVEALELRLTLSAYYDYSIIAQTGTGLQSIASSASINEQGQVAFVANSADGQSVYVASGTSAPAIVTFSSPSSTRTYGSEIQINDSGLVAAIDGISGQRLARIWDSADPGNSTTIGRSSAPRLDTTHFDGMSNFTGITNDGQVVLAGLESPLPPDPSFWEIHLSGSFVDRRDIVSFFTEVVEYGLPPAAFFRMRAADGDKVVVSNRQDGATTLELFDITGVDTSDTLASTSAGWAEVGIRPGISDDGSVVAFVGDQGAGRAVYLSFLNEAGARETHPIVAVNAGVPLGRDAMGAAIQFSDFDLDARLGVEIFHNTGGSAERFEPGETIIVSFIGTPGKASKDNPQSNAPFLFTDQRGLWTMKVDAAWQRASGAGPVSYNNSSAIPVVQIGDTISGQVISDLGVNDPLAKVAAAQVGPADHQLSFWARSGTDDLIFRAEQLDTDNDGLFNHWEVNGIDVDQDGTIDLPLNNLTADPFKKDLFLEIDWLPDDVVSGRTFAPQAGAINDLVSAFAAAPVSNPDGSTGITVHVDAGAGLSRNLGAAPGGLQGGDLITEAGTGNHIHALYLGAAGVTLSGTDSWGRPYVTRSVDDIKDNYFGTTTNRARELAFRYAIFGDQKLSFNTATNTWSLSDSSGQAELGEFGGGSDETFAGNDLIVTVGAFPTTNTLPVPPGGVLPPATVSSWFVQGQTLIHELGHTLGLLHGGIDSITSPPATFPSLHVPSAFKPSYRSVMNYAYQLAPDASGNLVTTYSGPDPVYNDWANIRMDFVRYFDVLNNTLNLTARGLSTPPPEEVEITATAFVVSLSPTSNADFDGDGVVDGADFLAWQLGSGMATGAAREQGDADADGDVDADDLGAWRDKYGQDAGGSMLSTRAAAAGRTLSAVDAVYSAGDLSMLFYGDREADFRPLGRARWRS